MIELELASERHIQALDLTDRIIDRDYPDGFLWLGCPHTTAALIVCEADAEMLADVETVAGGLLTGFTPFQHHKNDNPNGAAHLFSSLAGTQLLLPVVKGRVQLGTYQRIVFVELDGPRQGRRVQLESLAREPLAAADA